MADCHTERGFTKMLNIYICEDNPRELAMIKEKAENFIAFEELDIQLAAASPDPDEILKKVRDSTGCGLYFLDIDLKNENTNGFLLAQNIRKIEPRCFIVFITSHIELSISLTSIRWRLWTLLLKTARKL